MGEGSRRPIDADTYKLMTGGSAGRPVDVEGGLHHNQQYTYKLYMVWIIGNTHKLFIG